MPLALELTLRACAVMIVIIGLSRLFGLRSFSKLSGFDFPVTVALGSVLAGAVTTPDQSLWVPVFAIAGLFVFQMVLAPLRKHVHLVRRAVDNKPLIVMEGEQIYEENLKRANMTKSDLIAKLREANALRLDHIHAVIVEVTGEVSVLHGDPDLELAPLLMDDVRR